MMQAHQERLLGDIYDAAFNPDLWVGVMEDLARELGGEAACMTTLDVVTGAGGGYTALVPDDTMGIYVSQWARDNPLHEVGDPLSYITSWRPASIRYEEWIKRDSLHRSAFYNEFLRPIGSEHGIMMGLALVGTTTVTMNIARPFRRDVFSDEELALARRWQGHLSRAVRLGREVQISQAALEAVDQLVGTTPHRLFFLDARGQVHRMSAAAEAMLSTGSELRVTNGVLAAALPDEDQRLRRLIARAGRRDLPDGAAGTMKLRGEGGRTFDVSATALGPRGIATWSTEPIILVTVANGVGPALPIELRLRARFGLTPAEARVTLALTRGGTLREIADDASVSVHTVRSQLATIFSKTGCRRQADLVRASLTLE